MGASSSEAAEQNAGQYEQRHRLPEGDGVIAGNGGECGVPEHHDGIT